MKHSLFYDSLGNILPLGLGGAVNTAEEEEDLLSYLVKGTCGQRVEQILAPKSKYFEILGGSETALTKFRQ